jgi:hypothetical protein
MVAGSGAVEFPTIGDAVFLGAVRGFEGAADFTVCRAGGAGGFAWAFGAETARRGLGAGLSVRVVLGLATVSADGKGFAIFVFFGMGILISNPILERGSRCWGEALEGQVESCDNPVAPLEGCLNFGDLAELQSVGTTGFAVIGQVEAGERRRPPARPGSVAGRRPIPPMPAPGRSGPVLEPGARPIGARFRDQRPAGTVPW